jgi:hypothetical protein
MSEEISRLVSSAAIVVLAIDVCVCIITLRFQEIGADETTAKFLWFQRAKAFYLATVRDNTSLPVFLKKEDSRANNGT